MSLQSQKASLENGKRKFGERMTLEEAGRADFDNGQGGETSTEDEKTFPRKRGGEAGS